jgi:hypothetical protein
LFKKCFVNDIYLFIYFVSLQEPEGVRDQQMLVNNIVGLDFDMWRMCVYLGQGTCCVRNGGKVQV